MSFYFSGKYCGDKFPPIITSSGRSLWLRFSSDKTISYTGFKAVYNYIKNPMEGLPDIGKCTFEIGGFQDFIGSTNISVDRTNHSLVYDTPIDCVWTIRVELNFQIYFQFLEYELEHPNDCNTVVQFLGSLKKSNHRYRDHCLRSNCTGNTFGKSL